jgi:hypothetical protein
MRGTGFAPVSGRVRVVTHVYIDGPYDGAELPAVQHTIERAKQDQALNLDAVPGSPPGEVVDPESPVPADKVRYVLIGFQAVSEHETAALYQYRPGEPA